MKYTFLIITLAFIAIGTTAQSPVQKGLDAINRQTLESQLRFLSSDLMNGREACTPDARIAGEYLASLYQQYGLNPGSSDSSFYQSVPLYVTHKPSKASINIIKQNDTTLFSFQEHFRPERLPQSIDKECEIIWAGYGINNEFIKELDTSSSQDKIIIRLKGLPNTDTKSKLSKWYKKTGRKQWLQQKAKTLQDSKAFAVFEYDLNDPDLSSYLQKEKADTLLHKRSSGIYKKSYYLHPLKKSTPHYYVVSKQIVEHLIPNFKEQLNDYLAMLQKGKVKNISIPAKAQLSLTASSELKHCNNIIAQIKGSSHPDEIIVVGGHYDHLGSYDGRIWNGADDNGSGAIGTATIAKAFMATGIQPKRTIIFANWTAEERGLHGSNYFVNNFDAIDRVKYYHNYDMIGRSANYSQPDSLVSFIFTESWDQVLKMAQNHNNTWQLGLKIMPKPWDKPTGGSDNAYFARKNIPIVWFHTEGHPQYHMPDDTIEKIDWAKFEAIVKTSFLILWDLANE